MNEAERRAALLKALEHAMMAKQQDPDVDLNKVFSDISEQIAPPPEWMVSKELGDMGQNVVNVQSGAEHFVPTEGPHYGEPIPYPGGHESGATPEWYLDKMSFQGPSKSLKMPDYSLDVGPVTIDEPEYSLEVGTPTIAYPLDDGVNEQAFGPVQMGQAVDIGDNMRVTPKEMAQIMQAGLDEEEERPQPMPQGTW